MKVTHIEHSGFLIELEHCMLLFDWYTGSLPVLNPDKALYVFVSHSHGDHYGSCIWSLQQSHPEVFYILSHDTYKKAESDRQASGCIPATDHLLYVRAHETHRIGSIQLETLLSTDKGVAYYIEADGHTLYHAGDLNLWYWEGEPEENNRWQIGTYQAEIQHLKGRQIDLAFLTLDPRQEKDAPRGIAYFMKTVGCSHIFPMHYWNRPEAAKAYLQDPRLLPYASLFRFEDHIQLT